MDYTTTKETFVAMPVTYKGTRFRSKLEAKWAVFFDLCGVEWVYEPDVSVPGVYYQPDFLLKNVLAVHGFFSDDNPEIPVIGNLFVEVKGQMSKNDAEKVLNFSNKHPILVTTDFPEGETWDSLFSSAMNGADHGQHEVRLQYNFRTIDNDEFELMPAIATKNGTPFMALVGADGNYERWAEHEATECAYSIARNAKFDHGQTPLLDVNAFHIMLKSNEFNSLKDSTMISIEDKIREKQGKRAMWESLRAKYGIQCAQKLFKKRRLAMSDKG